MEVLQRKTKKKDSDNNNNNKNDKGFVLLYFQ